VKSFQPKVQQHTAAGLRVTDITELVADAVRESGVRDGICSVYSPHTTCSVRVNEWERGFLEDFAMMLKRLVPAAHNRTENISPEDEGIGIGIGIGNGHAHCTSMLLGPAGESIPVRNGELCLGTWQRVLFLELELDRDRRWLVQVVGV
jgi:secondary thiamine-phosphate synthase enzyme